MDGLVIEWLRRAVYAFNCLHCIQQIDIVEAWSFSFTRIAVVFVYVNIVVACNLTKHKQLFFHHIHLLNTKKKQKVKRNNIYFVSYTRPAATVFSLNHLVPSQIDRSRQNIQSFVIEWVDCVVANGLYVQ